MPPLDLRAFAAAWTDLYAVLDKFGYWREGAHVSRYVVYPPHAQPIETEGPDVQPPLSPSVNALLQLLPFPKSYEASIAFELLPRTRAEPCLDRTQLCSARDPEMHYESTKPRVIEGEDGKLESNVPISSRLKPEEIALTRQTRYGMTIILDVEQGERFQIFRFLCLNWDLRIMSKGTLSSIWLGITSEVECFITWSPSDFMLDDQLSMNEIPPSIINSYTWFVHFRLR